MKITNRGRNRTKHRMPAIYESTSARQHIINTECQTLDQALSIIARKQNKKHLSRKTTRHGNHCRIMDEELGYRPKQKITMPKFSWDKK